MGLVKRDPFAREELHRELEEVPEKTTCKWCGGKRYFAGRKTNKLWRYNRVLDSGHIYYGSNLFCSASCYRSYVM